MAVRNIQSIKPQVWIPPQFSAIYKLEVVRADGSKDDLTDLAHSIEIEDGVTESVGRFSFELWNPNETYTGVWTGMEVVNYYSDYGTTASTLRFRGRIEKVSYNDNKIKVTGRSESLKLLDITVTKQYEDADTGTILKDLITNYATDFTSTNVSTSGIDLSPKWYQKPFWECIQELCSAAGFDCYVDSALDFHYFEAGSVTNNNEGIVHTYNLIEVGEFAEDISLIKNRIIIYGANQKDTQLIYTAEDTASQTNYGIREQIINDENITNYTQAKDYADYLLAESKDPPIVGEVKGLLLATIQPGEKIRISSPLDNLPPGTYKAISYKHSISESGLFTTVSINKEPRRISHVIKDRIQQEYKKQDTSLNPYEMRQSYNFLFEIDSGTHISTEITEGVLKLQSGESTGNWTSSLRSTSSDVSEVYLILNGETLTGASIQVSGDDGNHLESISNLGKVTLSDSKGSNLLVKVTITDTKTQIRSLSLLYKTD